MVEQQENNTGGLRNVIENPLQEGRERERKFLVRDLNAVDLDEFPKTEILQGYLAIEDNGDELRVRRKGEKFFLTRKSGSGLVREEDEQEISEAEFIMLFNQTADSRRVEKVRYEIPYGNYTIELDVFGGNLEGLVTAEVEFDDLEAETGFEPPDWLGEDVTESGKFANQKLTALVSKPEGVITREEVTAEQARFGLGEGLAILKEKIRRDLDSGEVTVTAVAGGSASGKTSEVADKLVRLFGDEAAMISMDDYSKGGKYIREQVEAGVELNFDMPDYVDVDLLAKHLRLLRSGIPVWIPQFDFQTGERAKTMRLVEPKRVIFVEGLFTLDPRITSESTNTVFVDIGMHGRAMRRLFRDVNRTRMVPNDILKYFVEVVDPMHQKYVEAGKSMADLIIENEYDPQVEAKNAGGREVQLKFAKSISPEELRKRGADRLGSFDQTDSYYRPNGINIAQRGESVRIRQEGDKFIFTYKGPKKEGKTRVRDRFDSEIDEATAKIFAARYGECEMEILKNRSLFKLGSVIIALDTKILRLTAKGAENLSDYVEVRFDKEEISDQEREALEALGLSMSEARLESYRDLIESTIEL